MITCYISSNLSVITKVYDEHKFSYLEFAGILLESHRGYRCSRNSRLSCCSLSLMLPVSLVFLFVHTHGEGDQGPLCYAVHYFEDPNYVRVWERASLWGGGLFWLVSLLWWVFRLDLRKWPIWSQLNVAVTVLFFPGWNCVLVLWIP